MKWKMAMPLLALMALSTQLNANTVEDVVCDEFEDGSAEKDDTNQDNHRRHYLYFGNSDIWYSSGYTVSRRHPAMSGFTVGYNGWGNAPFSLSPDTSTLELNGCSFNLTLYLLPVTLYNLNSTVMVSSAVGFKWRSFKFTDKSQILTEGEHGVEYSHFTDNGKKNKLKMTYLTVPLRLDLYPNDNWHFVAGVEGNMRLCSKVKAKSYDDGKFKKKDDYYINPLSCNVILGINYCGFGIMASKDITPLFKDGKGPEVYPYTVGVSFDFSYIGAGFNIGYKRQKVGF